VDKVINIVHIGIIVISLFIYMLITGYPPTIVDKRTLVLATKLC